MLITGGHGAGLTNMIFAANNATVIEFGMRPHVDRCYGYMAMALGFDYWLVPQVDATYFSRFVINKTNAAAVARLLRHVLQAKGLDELLVSEAKDEL